MVRTAVTCALARAFSVLVILLGLAGWAGMAVATEVDARLSQSTAARGQFVELIIETSGGPRGHTDLSVLEKDFRIVDRRTSSSVNVLNGQRSERHRLVLRLLPRRSGELTVPPIPVGEMRTAPLSLTVTPASQGESLALPRVTDAPAGARIGPVPAAERQALIEAELDAERASVEEQVLLGVRVLSRDVLADARLHDPEPEGARVLPLGEERTSEVRDGQLWQVYERRYALFPQRSGPLEIAPLLFESRPPAGTGLRQPIRALSQALTLDVGPRPVLPAGVSWLPARSVRLTETGDADPRRRLDERWQRIVTVTAEGRRGQDLPALGLNAPFELDVHAESPQVWDERTRDGVVGHRRERIWLKAREPGRYTLPQVRLPWWDTANDALRYAVLPARTVDVNGREASGEAGATEDEGADVARQTQPAGTWAVPASWSWLAALVAVLLVAVFVGRALAHREARRLPAPAPAPADASASEPSADARAEAIAAVRGAYRNGNARAAREALLAWAHQQWPSDPPGNLTRLSVRCPEPLRRQIVLLEKAFFSPEPLPWDREAVWEGLEAFASPAPQPDSPRSG